MKILIYIFGGVAILGLIIWGFVASGKPASSIASYSTGDPNAPKAEASEKKFDFGKITLKDEPKHDFKIKNTGKTPLVITDIMTSCHCTSAVFKMSGKPDSPVFGMMKGDSWQGEVAPGAEASIEAVYKPAIMPVKGAVSRVITFNTNDPDSKEIQLEIIAEVE